jgi:signal transduction histidine kinase/CheY-like chemotaxis protein/HPt (histidine-containing phosphotransfer) domain-containing protein
MVHPMPEFTLHVPGLSPLPLSRQRNELVLGRAPDSDGVLADPAISRRHARFSWREGEAWIEDLGSRHGTFVNGRRIQALERVVPGDRITLGRLEARLEGAQVPGEASGPEETPLSLSLGDLRRWERRSERPQALDLLHEASLLLLRDQTPETLLATLLDRLFAFLEASRGAVLLPGPDGALAPLAVRTREPAGPSPLGISRATLESTLNRRVAMLFREPRDPEAQGRISESNATSVMAVPLEHDGQVLGIFYFDAAGERAAFTEAELRLVATLGNLAAAKLLEQRLREELERKRAAEREVRAREASAQAKEAFLARVSHEIRTPMSAVLGFARLAQAEALAPRARECLDRIQWSGERLLAVVGEILDFSRLESGRMALEAAPFDLGAEARAVLATFGPAAHDKGLELGLDLPGGEPGWVVGDPLRLGQILTNLLGNAIKFTERGGVRLEVSASAASRAFAFAVRDTGIGIAPEAARRIFSPFEQAAADTTRRFGGTGLGLAIARELVERMGGTLAVDSTPGRGSTFSFVLELPEAQAVPVAPAPGAVPDLSGRRILLAEDHPLNQELARAVLEGAGAQVTSAWNGEEALARLEEETFDAVLLDLHMPGMNGREVARSIRSSGRALPLLAMTAEGGPEAPFLEAGMDEVLTKPVEPRLLLEALARRFHARTALPAVTSRPEGLELLAPVMDLEGALARMNGRGDLLLAFLRGFLEEPPDPEPALVRGDLPAARRAAHDLKGMARTLGLDAVAGEAARLEEDLEEGRDSAEARAALRSALEAFLPLARAAAGGLSSGS